MSNTLHDIPELDRAGLRKFGITTGLIIAGLFGLLIPWAFNLTFVRWPWILCAVLVFWGLIAPMSLNRVYKGWMRFGLFMSKITTPIIMGSVFFLMITPIALIIKILGKDAMKRELTESEDTYRVVSVKTARERLERPY